jgi:hypothetical protein
MYLKVWKFRLYVKCEARMVKKSGKTKHARELARTARTATAIYAFDDATKSMGVAQ